MLYSHRDTSCRTHRSPPAGTRALVRRGDAKPPHAEAERQQRRHSSGYARLRGGVNDDSAADGLG